MANYDEISNVRLFLLSHQQPKSFNLQMTIGFNHTLKNRGASNAKKLPQQMYGRELAKYMAVLVVPSDMADIIHRRNREEGGRPQTTL